MSSPHPIPVLTPGHGGGVHGAPCAAVVSVDFAKLRFPIEGWHGRDFRHGAIAFGAPRRAKHGHRAHAGIDILAPFGTKLYAMADGFIRQPPYYFYEGTNAIEVVFPGVGVARYGEVKTHQEPRLRGGQAVKAGELIGHVGRLNSGASMLHFELYQSREASKDVADIGGGPLSTPAHKPYERHVTLVNPTQFMWALHERASAGK